MSDRLDEYNAYAHSLASRHCIRDQFSGSTSARDEDHQAKHIQHVRGEPVRVCRVRQPQVAQRREDEGKHHARVRRVAWTEKNSHCESIGPKIRGLKVVVGLGHAL